MGRLIRQGSKGADVRAIQDVLNFHIRRLTPLEVDGDFGPLTHARVVEFQKSNQLKPDGIVGPNTMGKLFEEEQLPITLVLTPRQAPTIGGPPRGIQPPRLIPPLTLPPLTPPLVTPFFLPPDSFSRVPALTPAGQTMTFVMTAPVRNDPVDPATASFAGDHAALGSPAADVPLPRIHPWRCTETCQESRASRIGPGFADELRLPVGRQAGVRPQVNRPARRVRRWGRR